MKNKPTILPLDINGNIYLLKDEHGATIGTGTLEVCEVLLTLITKSETVVEPINKMVIRRQNIRSAISI